MKIRVWGLASGFGATKDAARGAFAWREYQSEAYIQRKDWQDIMFIEKIKEG